jgi:integrase/recombinase XerD
MTSLIMPAGVGDASPPVEVRLSLAAAAYLARFNGMSREHTASDLQAYLGWCADRDIEPVHAGARSWSCTCAGMQEARQYKPSTVSRRTSVLAGFYHTCVITAYLSTPPRRAMLTAAREPANRFDFARVAMLGLLGLRIFEA